MRLSLGLLADVGVSPLELVDVARAAEGAGFHGVYMVEYEYDSTAINEAILLGTERITVGSAVLRAYTRHPLATAQTAAVLDQLAPGRYVIGLGSGPGSESGPDGQLSWGLPWDRAVGRLSEQISVIRLALSGEPVDFGGEFYRSEEVQLAPLPVSERIPIRLAAGGEQFARLAGRKADGAFLHMANQALTERTLNAIREGETAAGRRAGTVTLQHHLMTCVANDRDQARRAMRAHLVGRYLNYSSYYPLLAAAGWESVADRLASLEVVHHSYDSVDEVLADDQSRQAAEALTDEFLDDFTIAGTPDECRRLLERVASWGSEDPILYVFPTGDDDWRTAYMSAIAAFGSA